MPYLMVAGTDRRGEGVNAFPVMTSRRGWFPSTTHLPPFFLVRSGGSVLDMIYTRATLPPPEW